MSNYDPRRSGGDEYVPQQTRPAASVPTSRPAPAYDNAPPWPVHNVPMPGDSADPPTTVPSTPRAQVQENPDEAVVYLSKAYRAHDIMVDRIVLRRPKGREIAKCGNPLRFVSSPDGRVHDIDIKWDVVIKYIPLLASPPLPPSTVDEFDYFDLDACAAALGPFFVKLGTSGN